MPDAGNPLFLPAVTYNPGDGGTPVSVAIGDLNGDGHPDLVLGFYLIDNVISVLLGNGDGTFGPPVTYNTGGSSGAVALADVNGDGNLDVMVAEGFGRVGVMLGNGNGTFQPVRSYSTGGQNPKSIAVADVNNDGKLDLVVANSMNLAACKAS